MRFLYWQLLLILPFPLLSKPLDIGCAEAATSRIWVDSGHAWRPPFGIDRVGARPVVHVELPTRDTKHHEYYVVSYHDGKEIERRSLQLARNESHSFATAQLTSLPTEVAVYTRYTGDGSTQELARQLVKWPEIEADARARPDRQINPVDLGSILVPNDWLLLAAGQSAVLDVAAIPRTRSIPDARLRAWFDGDTPVEVRLPLSANQRTSKRLVLQLTSNNRRNILHVTLTTPHRELWKKDIVTMVIAEQPQWPVFGAVETKLRYDSFISVKDLKTETYSSMDYDTAWDPKLNDIVVFLPNGSRFVFWRGASYVPFWAGLFNTGLTYEWAETVPPPDAFQDAVEPLMDKELRYGHVKIMESTVSRIHVRWTYQSTDFMYKVFGDQATEDFYFYPDGFGTRVLTLTSKPDADYEITEFITLLPQSAYPLDVLPKRLIEMLFLDGKKRDVTFPYSPTDADKDFGPLLTKGRDPRPTTARVYRIFNHKQDAAAAIYFSPTDIPSVQITFKPFYDQGEIVTPGYWGNHWPLGRGATTGGAIDERVHLSPAHISTFCWGLWSSGNRPAPLSTAQSNTIDALGQSRRMLSQRWAWLIAKTDAADEELLNWAHSYSQPPSLEVTGARMDFPSYSAERRAIRLVAESRSIAIKLRPVIYTVNPVIEIDSAPQELANVTLDGKVLPADAYAWDGATLWVKATIDAVGTTLGLFFK